MRSASSYYLTRLRRIARERGGEVLSRRYVDDRTKLLFRCAEGHEWMQAPGSVKASRWCATCGIARRAALRKIPTVAALRRAVARRGGVILSREYVNSQVKLRYRCAEGHTWAAVPASILSGRWCPVCAWRDRMKHHAARKDVVLRRLLRAIKGQGGELLAPGFVHSKTKLRLRCRRGHRWEASAASIDRGIGCPQCREEASLEALHARAELWGGRCLARSYRNGRERLPWRCAQEHRFLAAWNLVKRGMWCRRCRQPGQGTIGRMHKIARERGGECRSRRYLDALTCLRWRCRAGHEWTATPGDIVVGHWCPKCRRGWSRPWRLSIEDVRRTARQRGGQCLSTVYRGSLGRLRWRCARGHTWMAHVNRVRQGSWCPVCAHSARGTIEGMRALALERGGRCLSRSWDDHRHPLLFECARAHRFRLHPRVAKTGLWCSECRPWRSA